MPAVKVEEIIEAIEGFAPLSLQAGFDNSGLTVGDPCKEVDSALLCVDATGEVVDLAISEGIGLVISHHPVIFHPLPRLTGEDWVQRVVMKAIRHGIALYGCHTNLDSVPGGMNHRLAHILGIRDFSVLSPEGDSGAGYGVVGMLDEAMDAVGFLSEVKRKLSLGMLRHSALRGRKVRRIALCTGSGASLIPAARTAGADIYLAADFKYNDFFSDAGDMIIADIGHFESEYCAIDLLGDIIQKKIPNFALRKSAFAFNPVKYL